jgi:hypothetical protein
VSAFAFPLPLPPGARFSDDNQYDHQQCQFDEREAEQDHGT